MDSPRKHKTGPKQEHIVPVTTYVSEIWAITEQTIRIFQVLQRAIEKKLLGINFKYKR